MQQVRRAREVGDGFDRYRKLRAKVRRFERVYDRALHLGQHPPEGLLGQLKIAQAMLGDEITRLRREGLLP